MVTRWIPQNSRSANVTGMIMLDVKRHAQIEASAVAADLAKQWGGRVSGEGITLDGEPAAKVEARAGGPGLQPTDALACVHEGRLYLLTAGGVAGESRREEVEFIRKNWQWLPVESPARHLSALRETPLVACGGRVLINFPAVMTTFDGGNADRSIGLSAYNYVRDAPDFTALVQFGDVPRGDDIRAMKERIGTGIPEKFGSSPICGEMTAGE
jgi:hypothetical protein